jgi:nitric oxide reductase subunit B
VDDAGAVAERRPFLISKGWVQAVLLVVLCGFFVLGLLAYRTYMAHPPVPARVVDPNGAMLFTGDDISRGQQVFLHNGLMEYGSVARVVVPSVAARRRDEPILRRREP